jgi:hypothetical protein
MENINERIVLIINEFRLKQKEFSEKIGANSLGTLNNIIHGRKSKPSFELIEKICLSFEDIDANWLITGKGEMFKKNHQMNIYLK